VPFADGIIDLKRTFLFESSSELSMLEDDGNNGALSAHKGCLLASTISLLKKHPSFQSFRCQTHRIHCVPNIHNLIYQSESLY